MDGLLVLHVTALRDNKATRKSPTASSPNLTPTQWPPRERAPQIDPLFAALMFGWIAFNSFSAMRAEEVAEAPARRWREYEERDW